MTEEAQLIYIAHYSTGDYYQPDEVLGAALTEEDAEAITREHQSYHEYECEYWIEQCVPGKLDLWSVRWLLPEEQRDALEAIR